MTEVGRPAASELAPPRVPGTLYNVIWNWGGFFFSGVVNFLLAPFVVRHLGNTGYGVAVLVMSLTGYLGILDLGVRGAVTRYVARFHAQSDHAAASRLASSAIVLFSVIGAVTTVAAVLVGLANYWLPVLPAEFPWARTLVVLVGPLVGCSLLGGIFSGILMALQRFDHVNAVGGLSTLLRALVIVWVLSAGGGLIALMWVQLAATVATTLACAWISFHFYPELRPRLAAANEEHVRILVSFSLYSFTLLVFDGLLIYLNAALVGILMPVSLVTFFWIAGNLVNYSFAIVGAISKIATPQASVFEVQEDRHGLQRMLLNGTGYGTAAILPIALTYMLRGHTFIGLWMGAEYAELSGHVLWILSIALVFSASSQVNLATMLGISKHKSVVPVLGLQALGNLVVAAVLVPSRGVTAVAWAIALSYAAVGLFYWPKYVHGCLHIPVRRYVTTTWIRPALAMTPFALATYGLHLAWPASNLIFFFAQTGLILPLALLGFWFVCVPAPERQAYIQGFRRPVRKAAGQGSRD